MWFDFLSIFSLSLFHIGWISGFGGYDSGDSTYDYVVIGGGTAGLAIASRLSELLNSTVIVLEAGSNVERLPEVFIPGLVGTGQAFTTLNWGYKTIPQEHLNGRTTTINAGKALGGSTIINSMIFPRAEKEQYDAWGTLNDDDPQWTWDSMLPFFRKLELFTRPTESQVLSGVLFDEHVHGTDVDHGRVKVGYPNYFYDQSKMWHNASGFSPSPDLSNGSPQGTVGVAPNSLDAQNNTRCSSVCAYYTPFSNRPNFRVLTGVFVNRILWSMTGTTGATRTDPLKAIGVEYRTENGLVRHVNVRKEVIVSAGTIATPKILELSGVGNTTILKNAGVTPILDLPTVGENLADHVHGWANAFTNASVTRDLLTLDPRFKEEQQDLWFHNRSGVLSAAPRSLGLAVASDLFTPVQLEQLMQHTEDNMAHYALLFSNGNLNLAKGIEAQYAIVMSLWKRDKLAPVELNLEPGYAGPTAFEDRPHEKYTSINAVLFSPLSRGRTHVNSSNPADTSVIDPAYYSHPLDLAIHTRGIQLGRSMLQTPPLDTIYQGEYEPGPEKTSATTVEEWTKNSVSSDNHVVGTMAMLPADMGGVVDTRLKIYGVQNVRIVDASIIPIPISAHICSTVYMIAEKAAEFIREDSSLQ
ncbi:GMC oxidoreductase [Hypholoma sublateritium FD-334 SS-4]|uniref:pyranose dehydrogenase (acceptor) n=1 Tax=Hypholoma sublateritium (strain FD-334 SS-4) TaxID=945553 RepID=A0A0D2P2M6_HYPSF|nr:GMC oxidoreductase [Hypholoma sublateritium FD-334 SS-4]